MSTASVKKASAHSVVRKPVSGRVACFDVGDGIFRGRETKDQARLVGGSSARSGKERTPFITSSQRNRQPTMRRLDDY